MDQALGGLLPIIELGATGILLGFIWYFLRIIAKGDWVPKRELDYTRQDRDARIVEALTQIADWRAAHETSERSRELQAGQVGQLVEALRAQERFFDAFRTVIERNHHEREDDAAL